MAKAMTVKAALRKCEEKSGEKASEAKDIDLQFQVPSIYEMDASLCSLTSCEKLSLAINCIEKITNLIGLKNLKILALSRNNIKELTGLEAVGNTLVELWISYNLIDKLEGVNVMKKLKVLHMSNNLVDDWAEFMRLADLPCLVDLVFVGNPLQERLAAEENWMNEACKNLPNLTRLDGKLVIKLEVEEEDEMS